MSARPLYWRQTFKRVHAAGQIGDQRLKAIARNLQQRLAASLGTLLDPLANHNQSPARLLQFHFLHFQPGDFGSLPMRLIMPAEALYLLRQARHKNEFQTQCLGHVLHAGLAKTRVAAHQLEAECGRANLATV